MSFSCAREIMKDIANGKMVSKEAFCALVDFLNDNGYDNEFVNDYCDMFEHYANKLEDIEIERWLDSK